MLGGLRGWPITPTIAHAAWTRGRARAGRLGFRRLGCVGLAAAESLALLDPHPQPIVYREASLARAIFEPTMVDRFGSGPRSGRGERGA
jgi:hypothetical protein